MDKISRKSKDYNPMTNECMLPANLSRSRADFVRGITFLIRFVGRLEIDRPTNKDEIIAAMRRVRQEYKLRSFKKRSASLTISIDGLSVALMKKKFVPRSTETVEISWHHPINKVFYVSHDSRDLKVFSYIARDVPTNQFVCIVFKTSKEIATNIVSTIGKAFEVVHLMNNTKSDPTSPEVPRAASPDYRLENQTGCTRGEDSHESRRMSNQGMMTRSYSSTGITTDLLHPLELPIKSEDQSYEMKDRETIAEEEDHQLDEVKDFFHVSPTSEETSAMFEKRPIYEDKNYLIEEEEEIPEESTQVNGSSHQINDEDVETRKVEISERDLIFLKNQLIQLTKTLNFERQSNHFTELRLEKLSNEFYLMKDQFLRVIKKLAKEGIFDDITSDQLSSIHNKPECCMCKNFLAHCIKSQCPHGNTVYNRSITSYDIRSLLQAPNSHSQPQRQHIKMPRAETCSIELSDSHYTVPKGTLGQPKNQLRNTRLYKNASFDQSNASVNNTQNPISKMRNASCYKFSVKNKEDEKEPSKQDKQLIEFSPCKRSSTMFEMSKINQKHLPINQSMVTSKSHDFFAIREDEEPEPSAHVNPLFDLPSNGSKSQKFAIGVKESKSDQLLSIKPLPPPLNDTETNKKRIRKAQTLTESSNKSASQDFLVKIDELLSND